jgi:hypothetical protein
LCFGAALCGCTAERTALNAPSVDKHEKKNKSEQSMQPEPNSSQPQTGVDGCDPTLWDRVYDPPRLEVLAQCKVVTGTIAEQDQNEDGDTHMLLKLDPGQEDLLAKKNLKKKDGNLVIEVVCAHPPDQKKAKQTCEGYSTPITIPVVGDHVRVTGSYVNDTHNGWTEIHPVSKIEKQ